MQEVMIPVRLFFSKTGRAKYISHLDTMRTFTRAFRRTSLPLWYTQGFNPHLYMTFPLPLALGVESLREAVDFRLVQQMDFQRVADEMASVLPPGFGVVEVAAPVMPASAIAWAEYEIRLAYPEQEREAMLFALKGLFDKPSIDVVKKTKKGETLTDIRPHAALLDCKTDENGLWMWVRLAAGSTLNISPQLLLEAFQKNTRPADSVKILRTAILDAERKPFA